MKNITVIGAGTMGIGIAHVFAQKGFTVSLCDGSKEFLDKALSTISKNLDRQVSKGAITADVKESTLKNISLHTALSDAVKNTELVIEAATENIKLKKEIFIELDLLAPASAILATNTSSISITSIAAQTKRRDKVIGMHFFNPVPVMKLVEIIRGFSTSDEVTKTVMSLSQKLGKTPVEVNDYPGFVANRVLMPMINEAIFCVMEGVASAESVDTVMKLGMNHPMGPLALADLIGLDTCLAIMNVLHEGLGDDKYRPCPLLKRMVAAGQLGKKSGRGFYTYP